MAFLARSSLALVVSLLVLGCGDDSNVLADKAAGGAGGGSGAGGGGSGGTSGGAGTGGGTTCTVSAPSEATCGDGKDDDCDGYTDCLDPDCDAKTCGNGLS